MRLIHEKLRYDKQFNPKISKMTYSNIRKKTVNPSWEDRHTKVTLDVLQNMKYDDFNVNDEDDFDPTDVLDDDEIKDLERKERLRRKKAKSIANKNQIMPNEKAQGIKNAKRGVQMNQSQISGGRGKIPLTNAQNHKGINQAYDYAQGEIPEKKKAMFGKTRDQRSIRKLSQSYETGGYTRSKPGKGNYYPRSKQTIIKNNLALGVNRHSVNHNKSVHLRRAPGNYGEMNINENYQPASQKKLPMMKKQMRDRMKQIESTNKAKERYNMDGIMLMHEKHINKGLKTLGKSNKSRG